MSVQSARAFLTRAATDAAFEQRLSAATDNSESKPSALIAFATEEGFDFNFVELLATAHEIQGELSDQSLDAVAGGFAPKFGAQQIQDGTSNTLEGSRLGIIAVLIGM